MRALISIFLITILSMLSVSIQAKTPSHTAVAIFAGGCFWCLESDMDKVPGVVQTISGYTGGHVDNPSYKQVSNGGTGHYEAVKVIYDPAQVSYPTLLKAFWHNVDPLDGDGQFCDKGDQYRSAIFYLNNTQKKQAEASKTEMLKSGKFDHIATKILAAGTFYPAEEYHQGYYKKNPVRYKYYRYSCGRDQRLEAVWGGS